MIKGIVGSRTENRSGGRNRSAGGDRSLTMRPVPCCSTFSLQIYRGQPGVMEALVGCCIKNSPYLHLCSGGQNFSMHGDSSFLLPLLSSLAGSRLCFSSPSRMSGCPFKPNPKFTEKKNCLCVCVCMHV